MSNPEQRVLRHDLALTERELAGIAAKHGKQSPEYRQALKRFMRLWAVLRMTRSQDEFLEDVLS